jgi:UDP-glucose 4-epimerase
MQVPNEVKATGIVGATGFIGSYLCQHLSGGHQPLRVLVRCEAKVPAQSNTDVLLGTLLSGPDCERFASGLDVIYYLAHANNPFNSDLDQPADVALNLVPFLTLLTAIRALGRKPHVVYFSSGGAVYAPSLERLPYRECDPCAPTTSYGILKLAAEQYLRLAADRGELTATVLRVGNAYGTLLPQYRTQGLIGVALNQILHQKPVRIFGSAENVRDYVHLQDVLTMARNASVPHRPFDILNVGSGQGHSVNDVLTVIRNCHGSPFRTQMDAGSASWLPGWVVLDCSYARREFGWIPGMGLRAGIAAMLAETNADLCAVSAVAR